MNTPSANAYRAAARAIYEEGDAPGAVDIPLGATVIDSDLEVEDAGAWVSAYVWIPDSAARAHDPLTAIDAPAFVRAAMARRAERERVA